MISICIKKDFVVEFQYEKALSILLDLANSLVIKNIISRNSLQMISDAVNILFLNMIIETVESTSLLAVRDAFIKQPQVEMCINDLSRSVFMSKYHFIREFKKIVGLTPHYFQIQNRIRNAQHLLVECKHWNMAEVALSTGFCDQSHFIRYFKKIVGLTPLQYVKAQNILS